MQNTSTRVLLFLAIFISLTWLWHGQWAGATANPVHGSANARTVTNAAPTTYLPLQAANCVTPPAGLTNWWPGDDHARDIRGTQHGTLQNGAGFAAGLVGQAFKFDGNDDRVLVSPTNLINGRSEATIEAWVKPLGPHGNGEGFGGAVLHISVAGNQDLTRLGMFVFNDGRVNVGGRGNDAGGYLSVTTTQNIPLNQYTHIAGTWSAATGIKIYLNGAAVASLNSAVGAFANTNSAFIAIGSDDVNPAAGDDFNGEIDELTVYSRALTEAELQAIFNAGSAGKCRECTPAPTAMTNWWPSDGNTFDLRGALPGTLQNGAGFAAGMVGQAFSLDGVNDFVRITSTGVVKGQSQATVDAWVKPTGAHGTPSGTGTVWFEATSAGSGITRFGLFVLSDGRVQVAGRDSENGTVRNLNSLNAIPLNQWSHIAGTWEAGVGLKVYLNGALDNQLALAGLGAFTNTNSQNVLIGASASANANDNFNGQLDEIEVFNRALSQAEIQAIAKASVAGKCRACAPPPLQMAAWWPGDGNANDIQGTNHGTLSNGATTTLGLVNQAFSFDGADDAVTTSATTLNSAYAALTLDAWVYPLSHGQSGDGMSGRTIISKTEGDGFALRVKNGQIQPDLRLTGGNFDPVFNQATLPLNAWSHVTATYDGATIRAYLNGVELGSGVAATGTIKNTVNANVCLMLGNDPVPGCAIQSGGYGWHGLLDEVEVLARALAANEIRDIVNAGSAGKCRPSAPVACVEPPGQMTNWWPADNHTNDIQGAQNGTLNNGASFITGKVAQAFNFDGVDDFVSFGTTAGNFGAADFTMDFWLRTLSGQRQAVLAKRSGCNDASFFQIRTDYGGKIRVDLQESTQATFVNLSSNAAINDGVFHHVALTRQGTQLRLYLDGALDNSLVSAATTNINNNALLRAGRDDCVGSADGTVHFAGQLDEIEFFSRALSQAEIQAIYNAGSGGKCHSCATQPTGMVAWYPANGNANDIQGTNHGTLQNGAGFAAGMVGQAFNLDGVDDHATVANTASLDFGTGNFSLDAWVYLRSLTGDPHIFTKGTGVFPNDQTYFLHFSDLPPRGLRFVYRNTTGHANDHTVAFIPQLFTWYHVAAVREGNTSRIYVNGALLGTQTAGNNINTGTGGNAFIGRNRDAQNRYFNGLIDELELFNRALTQAEILAIFNAGNSGKCPCPTLTVNPATLPSGVAGMPYSQMLTASGGVAPHTFSLSEGALPTGLTLNSSGLLSGAPTVFGTFNFTVKAMETGNCAGTRAYTLVICPLITVNPATLPNADLGTAYNQTLTATGGTAPYNFTLSAGTLPTGLNLSSGDVLSGTPTAAGVFNFTVRATDSGNCSGERAYTLVVCAAITVNPASLPYGFVGSPYNQTFTATGGTVPYTFSVSSGALPGGLSLAGSGALTGTPTASGTFSFTVTATDSTGCTGTRSYTVIISGNGLQFFPLPSPVRLLDTRAGAAACTQPNAPIGGGASLTQMGRSLCTIPANAVALTGNITTVNSGGGFLTLYPSNATQPTVASTNYGPNEIINNVFTVGLGGDGAFRIFAATTTDVVVDVTGYYAPPATGGLFFHPLPAPVRLLETRAGQPIGCVLPGAPLVGGAESTQQAISACTGIPAAARAIVGNATTVAPQGGGFLTIFPADATRPLVASSNYNPGQVVNGPFSVGLTAAGQFKIFTTATTDLVVDVLGYYSSEATDANGAGLLLTPLAHPIRLLETRATQTVGCFKPGAPLAGGSETPQPARGLCDGITIPANALGVVGNATVVFPAAPGFLTLWPSTATRPTVATLNYNPGDVGNRHFIVGLGSGDGAFKVFTAATTELVIDLSGYFAP